jgi:hypothetical protein
MTKSDKRACGVEKLRPDNVFLRGLLRVFLRVFWQKDGMALKRKFIFFSKIP